MRTRAPRIRLGAIIATIATIAIIAIIAIIATIACGPAPAPALEVPADPRRCKPAPGTTGSPGTLEEAVALANGLPFPVTAECYVEALDRPLRIEATKSRTSLQKAEGERSPRVFLWSADSATALDRVRNPEFPRITRCFVCHDHEEDEPSVPGGRSSASTRAHVRPATPAPTTATRITLPLS